MFTTIIGFMISSLLINSPEKGNSFLPVKKPTEVILKPAGTSLMTDIIQKVIDKCADEGGGIIHFTEGTYFSGAVELKSHITLILEKGTVIQGSSNYSDYSNDAFFYGSDLSDVTIRGKGIIDGVDCYNPKGEEGFRGPHCIRLINCRNIRLEGFTIKNSANWAINCRKCSYGSVTNVTIRGGHDGLHTRFCNNFTVRGCDFRTGDDAFAGNDNQDFYITDCLINTSCNGFRMGCWNLTVQHCRFWGPGEFMHKIQNRNNMLSAFVHFSPKNEKPELKSGNWIIRDIIVENVDNFYIYNFRNGLWQTGQPVTSVKFENITATGILKAFYIVGDPYSLFNLSIRNSAFVFREGKGVPSAVFEGAGFISNEFFYADTFNKITLDKTAFVKQDTNIILNCRSGNEIILRRVKFDNGPEVNPYNLEDIREIVVDKTTMNGNKL